MIILHCDADGCGNTLSVRLNQLGGIRLPKGSPWMIGVGEARTVCACSQEHMVKATSPVSIIAMPGTEGEWR